LALPHICTLRTIQVRCVSADDVGVMPNLYFCQPHAQNQGMLRAVLSVADCTYLFQAASATYLGKEFPKVCDNGIGCADFAVLSVSSDEANVDWQSGHYRVDVDLMKLNAQLSALTR
jgi:hypothetical protein